MAHLALEDSQVLLVPPASEEREAWVDPPEVSDLRENEDPQEAVVSLDPMDPLDPRVRA